MAGPLTPPAPKLQPKKLFAQDHHQSTHPQDPRERLSAGRPTDGRAAG